MTDAVKSRNYYHFGFHLDDNMDGTGNLKAIGDYSSTATNFGYTCPEGHKMKIYKFLIHIEDSGSLDSGSYGNNLSITTGIHIYVNKSGTITELTDNGGIKTNAQWSNFTYDSQVFSFGSGDSVFAARLDFNKLGKPISLGPGDSFYVTLNDNYTGLEDHGFIIQGIKRG